jgi:hypothetical protein
MKKNKLVCLDNGGETFDRYTIRDKSTGDIIGASEHPFSPQGFGQYCGNVAHNYWVTAYGHGWDRTDKTTVNKRVKFGVDHFLNDCARVGKIIPFDKLPPDVQKYATQSFLEDYATR